MSEPSSQRHANGLSVPEQAEADDPNLLTYRVSLESPEEEITSRTSVRAGSMQEALAKVLDPDQWRPRTGSGSDPRRFRVVEVTEETAAGEVLQQRKARRRYLNTIVEAGLTALGKTLPDRSDEEFFGIFCDFFARAVVWPGEFAFPAGDAEHEHLLASDGAGVLTQLLTVHLSHHGLKVVPDLPE